MEKQGRATSIITRKTITWYKLSSNTSGFERIRLGSGTYGTVYKYTADDGMLVAVKEALLNEDSIPDGILTEVAFLTILDHPNIINLLDVFIYEEGGDRRFDLVLPLADMGNLYDMIEGGLLETEQDKKLLCAQMLRAVSYLHSNDILHGDIKPENILGFSESGGNCIRYVLSDFGIARNNKCVLRLGLSEAFTLSYRAPEILLGGEYDEEADIWALGCVFLEVLGENPFLGADSEIDLLYRLFKVYGTPNEKTWPDISEYKGYSSSFPIFEPKDVRSIYKLTKEQYSFLSRLLVLDPKKRATAEEALDDRFFDDIRDILNLPCLYVPKTERKGCLDILASRESKPKGKIDKLSLKERSKWLYRSVMSIRNDTDISPRDIALGIYIFQVYMVNMSMSKLIENLELTLEACLLIAITLFTDKWVNIDILEAEIRILKVYGPNLFVSTSYDFLNWLYVLERDIDIEQADKNREVSLTLLQCSFHTRISEVHKQSTIASLCYSLATIYTHTRSNNETDLQDVLIMFCTDMRKLWVKNNRLNSEYLNVRKSCNYGDIDTDTVLLSIDIVREYMKIKI